MDSAVYLGVNGHFEFIFNAVLASAVVMQRAQMIVLGRISIPYGTTGWLRLRVFGDEPTAWRSMPQWWLGEDARGDEWTPYSFKSMRFHNKGLLVSFAEVTDRTLAQSLKGFYVAAPREALPDTKDGEYYWSDLLGLTVVNEMDMVLGQVNSLLESGAHPVLCVGMETDGKQIERLLPFTSKVISNVDLAGKQIRVNWEADW